MTAISPGAKTAAAIDAVVDRPVLVVGSPPPGGRDLDLLADAHEYDAIARWLSAAGFQRWRHSWVRLAKEQIYCVDLSSTERWSSGTFEPSHLRDDAEAVPGYAHLVRPGPVTVLLLNARGTVTRRGRITDKVRRRVSAALEREPAAWALAEERAPAAGMVGALHLLRRAYEAEGPLPTSARVTGLGGVLLHAGPARAKAKVLADVRPRTWRPAIVSFSGLDGSGKSTQVAELRSALSRLGVPAEAQWAGFKTGSRLRGALPLLDRPTAAPWRPASSPADRDPLVPAACRDSVLGRHLWSSAVVTLNAISLWQHVLVPRRGTKVVIFDRFSPDSAVKLDMHYVCNRHFAIPRQRRWFARLSPKPDVGFLVSVPSDVAYARRQDQTPEELALMTRLYEDSAARFGLIRLDGTRPVEDLAHQVLASTWQSLR